MDESKFKRHGNIGHAIQTPWVLGACERGRGWERTIIVEVPNRN